MPGTKGNTNSLKHGGYSRVPLSILHPALEQVRRRVYRLRLALEGFLLDSNGTITPLEACLLHSAMTHEFHAEVWERRMRKEYPSWTIDQLATATSVISRERDRRDAALAKLPLSREQRVNVFDSLYARALPAPAGDGGNGAEAVEAGERGTEDEDGQSSIDTDSQ